jgi:hypothetical protein
MDRVALASHRVSRVLVGEYLYRRDVGMAIRATKPSVLTQGFLENERALRLQTCDRHVLRNHGATTSLDD